ncbi:MAG: ECF-type sigma factor [Isosphaeraceae bacterium]|nr:ECF-type sigma factor [Isosphaeraceae bacterium]
MTDDASVSRWLEGLRAGDDVDIRRLWDRYFERLVALARTRLPARERREFDEEDVALSAFRSFCERAADGRFPQLADRDDLWRVLSVITARKAVAHLRYKHRLKRGGRRLLGESALGVDTDPNSHQMAQVFGREPTPADAAEFADDCERLFALLNNPTLKDIALRRLEGQTADEIGAALGVSPRTVDRKLQLIRALWEESREDTE